MEPNIDTSSDERAKNYVSGVIVGWIALVGLSLSLSLLYERNDFRQFERIQQDNFIIREGYEPAWKDVSREVYLNNIIKLSVLHGFLLIMGLAGIYLIGRRLKRSERECSNLMVKMGNMMLVDELTGLYNRRGFMTLAETLLKLAERLNKGVLLYFVDVDNMKWINDTYGHLEGDNVLKKIAELLEDTFRESDLIARIGGDEFVALLLESQLFTPETFSTRLQYNIDAANVSNENHYKLSVSNGISKYDPGNPLSLDKLIEKADRLMYEQKRAKRSLVIN